MEIGEIEVFIDGRSVIHAKGLTLRDEDAPESYVQGIHFQTFFGGKSCPLSVIVLHFLSHLLWTLLNYILAGHSPEWASPKDQRVWFTSISGAILAPTGAEASRHDEL